MITAVGAVMIFNPKLFFDITESWKSCTRSEPSDFYLLTTRLGGILCLLTGIAGIVMFVLLG
ncbi:MAG: hypothetical protein HFG73_10230 [Hungatella sp.]|nr:hypothetical protein [Hungatella sp.]